MFEDVHLPSKPKLEKALENLNYFFAFIFALEFVLKIIGLGMVGYFSSFWNCLDSLIVAVSLVCLVWTVRISVDPQCYHGRAA